MLVFQGRVLGCQLGVGHRLGGLAVYDDLAAGRLGVGSVGTAVFGVGEKAVGGEGCRPADFQGIAGRLAPCGLSSMSPGLNLKESRVACRSEALL